MLKGNAASSASDSHAPAQTAGAISSGFVKIQRDDFPCHDDTHEQRIQPVQFVERLIVVFA
jgi:hypothetical protein